MNEKLKERGISSIDKVDYLKKELEKGKHDDDENDDHKKDSAPIDYAFEVGMIETKLDAPKLQLPEAKDSLYVTRPIN